MSTELEDFQNLVTHPGWLRLVHSNKEYWQEQLGTHLAACANERDDVAALNKMRQVIAAKQAVERFIAQPSERIRVLDAPQPQPSLTRGGL